MRGEAWTCTTSGPLAVSALLTDNVPVALQWLRESGPTEAGNTTLKIADSMGVLINPASPFVEFEIHSMIREDCWSRGSRGEGCSSPEPQPCPLL